MKLLNEKGVFNANEVARKTNLMHVLNIMAALIGGFSNRNEKAIEHLDDFALVFERRDSLVRDLERSADFILKLGLRAKSYWLNKANVFSLVVAVVVLQHEAIELNPERVSEALARFQTNLPDDYRLAATEGVNSTRARALRHGYLYDLLRASATA